MTTIKFKTNIKCGGCIAAVTPHLAQVEGIEQWEVDTKHPDKILSVSTKTEPQAVVSAIEKAGYKAQPIV